MNIPLPSVTIALKRLENWLASWQSADGSYHGVISTFWESSYDTIQANAVHQAPIIRGYLHLHRVTGRAEFLERAVRAADFLVDNLDARGHFRNTCSDVPGKPGGPIQDIECDLALLTIYEYLEQRPHTNKYLNTVLRNTDDYLMQYWWNGKVLSHQVANQIAKSGELFMWLHRITRQSRYQRYAIRAGDWLIQHQITSGIYCGAIEQSAYDSRLITVYEAACLPCLTQLAQSFPHRPRYRLAAERLTKFLLSAELAEGGFIGFWEQSLYLKLCNWIMRTIPMTGWFLHYFKHWGMRYPAAFMRQPRPVFIARVAEILLNLQSANLEQRFSVLRHRNFILQHQLASGGFMNYIGTVPKTIHPWAGQISSTRWSAFVFEYLASHLPNPTHYHPELDPLPPMHLDISEYGAIIETTDYIGWLTHDTDQSTYCLERVFAKRSAWPLVNNLPLIGHPKMPATPKTLLIFTPSFVPEVGGCASRISDFVQTLDSNQLAPIVVTKNTLQTERGGLHFIPMVGLSGKSFMVLLGNFLGTVFHITKHRADVVMVTIPPGYYAFVSALAVKLSGRSLIVDVRDPWVRGMVDAGEIHRETFKFWLSELVENWLLRMADIITTTTNELSDILIRRDKSLANKICLVPNGINHTLLKIPHDLSDNSTTSNNPVFIYQGLMARPQAVGRFINHIPRLLELMPAARFVFVGFGDERTCLQSQTTQLGLDRCVSWFSTMSRAKVNELIAQADYGVVTLADEFGYAVPSKLFEYLTQAKPIVAIVPPHQAVDRLLTAYKIGINLFSTPFRPLENISASNIVYRDFSRPAAARRLEYWIRSIL